MLQCFSLCFFPYTQINETLYIYRQYCQIVFENHEFEKVFFHGLISLNKRDNLLKRSKYGLNCFYSEHFGRSTLEMQKLGMIVFAKNAGGVREILLSDFQKFHSYNELFDNIIKIHFDSEVKEQILINNKKLFKKSLTDRQFSKSFISNFK